MRSWVMEMVLTVLTTGSGVLSFWLWRNAVPFVIAGSFARYELFIFPALALAAAACFFGLSAALVRRRFLLISGIAALFGVAFFLIPVSSRMRWGSTASAAACLLLALFASRRMHRENMRSLGFSVSKILKAGLPVYLTAFSLMVSVFYYGRVGEREKAVAAILPRPAIDLALGVLSGAVGDLGKIPQVNSLMTVDEFLEQNLRQQAGTRGIPEKDLSHKQVAELLVEQRRALAERYGISFQGNERLADVLHRTITARVEDLLGPYVRFLPVVSSAAFFFAFKAFTFPVYYLAVIAASVLIKFLLSVKILKKGVEKIEVERITLA